MKVLTKQNSIVAHEVTSGYEGVYANFDCHKHYQISSTRLNSQSESIAYEKSDVFILTFDDDTEWIGSPEDIPEVYGTANKRSTKEFTFTAHVSHSNSRGVIKDVLVKSLQIFRPKALGLAAKMTAKHLVESYDKKIQESPGLFSVNSAFHLHPITDIETNVPYLLLIHGTLSTTKDAFGDLQNGKTPIWNQLVEKYKSRIIALEHWTLSQSPIKNAIDLLERCPDLMIFDILSHSRGGLVADILAKCDHRNNTPGFCEEELAIAKGKDPINFDLMKKLNQVISTKKITIRKTVRVAAPSSGTTILSRRTDHFFNLMLNALGLAFGPGNPVYSIIKTFLLEIISHKSDPSSMAGLNSMMPESCFQKILNYSDNPIKGELYTISGDAEIGGISLDSLKVILANLFYQTPNDLVVDTDRMKHGAPRLDGVWDFVSKDKNTNHFRYFSNKNTCSVIVEALQASSDNPAPSFTKLIFDEGQISRGVALQMFSLKGINYHLEDITGKKDIVIVLPGIMGSTLSKNGKMQWMDIPEINKGAIPKNLRIISNNKPDDVYPSGVIKKYYDDLVQELKQHYDVITFPYDWRKSLTFAAKKLKEKLEVLQQKQSIKKIHIIAHSMGGLVVRQLMMDHQPFWERFKGKNNTKFIMLGTPWLGSYLIMETLTGHSGRVKQLAAIDFKNDKEDLLKVLWKYPGIFELLPIEQHTSRNFWEVSFWNEIRKKGDIRCMPDPNKNKTSLQYFKKYREKVLEFTDRMHTKDFENIFYISGADNETVDNYQFKEEHFLQKKTLVYWSTRSGDGSVTWKTGIPDQLPRSNLYYTRTSHGELANDPLIIKGIKQILAKGTTDKLLTDVPVIRGGETKREVHRFPVPAYNIKGATSILFDAYKEDVESSEEINVEIINGDLRVSKYPVMVGHFSKDLIFSAEKDLDYYLNQRLSQRHAIGYYPGKIGESEVFFNLNTEPKGAIVCGLGKANGLTIYLLSKTIEMAVLKYAMFMRDNYTLPRAKKYAEGISFILIGIGYGKLTIEDSVKGILLGVSKANRYIKSTKEGLKLIKNIEFVNYYESIASEAYWSLSRISNSDDRIHFKLKKGIVRKSGAKKKVAFANDTNNWWHNLDIGSIKSIFPNSEKTEVVSGFSYNSSNGYARVAKENVHIRLEQIDALLKELIDIPRLDPKLSNTLFELLIPNEFKDIIRNQNNLILKLDKEAAQIPWELLHDFNTDATPAAVSSGLIRQLLTEDSEDFTETSIGNTNVLVVGDPLYGEKLSPLPQAKQEAYRVIKALEQQNYAITSCINSNAQSIMLELFTGKFKILHFAGHGVYDPGNDAVGIVIGEGMYINPAMIKQLGYVPEFVFINCCFSGKMNAKDEKYKRNRYKFAANVGTQLIEMGVKAIVIAGWEVDDMAAKTFSDTFYSKMLTGYQFGRAVQLARIECFQNHPNTNTWGAYQCYGNQFYKFNDRQKREKHAYDYVIASQAYTDMDNLFASFRDHKKTKKQVLAKLANILKKVKDANLLDATIVEKEALIYDELGESETAVKKFEELFESLDGDFSMKVLEQYCTIKAHSLTSHNQERILSRIIQLTLVGRNSSRLNIVANSYKLASINVVGKKRSEYLTKAYLHYEESLGINRELYSGDYLDALSNMIFTGYLLEKENPETTLIDRLIQSGVVNEKGTTVENFLTEFCQKLVHIDQNDVNISVSLGITEMCLGLFLTTQGKEEELSKKIIKKYQKIFDVINSPRYIHIEINQIDFFTFYLQNDPHKIEYLGKIKNSLAELISD